MLSTLSVGREEIKALNWEMKLSSRLGMKIPSGKTRQEQELVSQRDIRNLGF